MRLLFERYHWESQSESVQATRVQPAEVVPLTPSNWRTVLDHIGIRGLARELAVNSQLVAEQDGVLELRVQPQHAQLRIGRAEQTLSEALSEYAGRAIKLRVEVGDTEGETPQEALTREANTAHALATAAIREDPTVQAICDMFDATVDPSEVQPRAE